MKLKLAFIFFLLMLLYTCKKDESHGSSVPTCCANPPIIEPIGNGNIYLPNIFTPNADGVNDLIHPFGDSNITRIISFQIADENENILFEELNYAFNYSTPASISWNGMVGNEVVKGIFTVKIEAESSDGTRGIVEGKVCSFPCDNSSSKEPPFNMINNCRFPTQHDGLGNVDLNSSSGEFFECFE